MIRRTVQEQITEVLEQLTNVHLSMTKSNEEPRKLELELMKLNVLKLYDKLLMLEKYTVCSSDEKVSTPPARPAAQVISEAPRREAPPVPTPTPAPASIQKEPVAYTLAPAPAPVVSMPEVKAPERAGMAEFLRRSINEPVPANSIPTSPTIPTPAPVAQAPVNTYTAPAAATQNPTPVSIAAPVVNKVEVPAPVVTQASPVQTPVTASTRPAPAEVNGTMKGFNTVTPAPVAEKFKEAPTVYDMLIQSRQDNSVISRIKKKAIDDLKTAIGINERFLIINEIFGGDTAAFNLVIDYFNTQCSSLEQAHEYINNNIRTKYKWNPRSGVVIDFLDLIERRLNR